MEPTTGGLISIIVALIGLISWVVRQFITSLEARESASIAALAAFRSSLTDTMNVHESSTKDILNAISESRRLMTERPCFNGQYQKAEWPSQPQQKQGPGAT